MAMAVVLTRAGKEFQGTKWSEERDEFIEIRNTASTVGRLPDKQRELTPSAQGQRREERSQDALAGWLGVNIAPIAVGRGVG